MSYAHDKADLLERLKKVEGQVRGLQRMVDEGRYCVDILMQIAAARAALRSVAATLLADHMRGCVVRALREGDGRGDEAVEELVEVLRRLTQ